MSHIENLQTSIYSVWLQTRNNFGRDSNQAVVRKLISDWFDLAKKTALLPDGETAKYKGQLAASEQVRIQQAHRIGELEREIERLKSGDYSPELREKERQLEGAANLLQVLEHSFEENFPGQSVLEIKEKLRQLEEIQRVLASTGALVS